MKKQTIILAYAIIWFVASTCLAATIDCNRTGYSMYSLSKLFKESFASCNGYYVGEQYYLSKGYVKPYSYYPVVGQARQDWTPDLTPNYLYYSPIFVDLLDDYNQHIYNCYCPDDIIEGVPFSTILHIAKSANNLNDVKTCLYNDIGSIYSYSEIDYQLSYYESIF